MSKTSIPRADGGFTLIEVLVALVLIATLGFSILNWVNTCLISLEKAKSHQQRMVGVRNAVAFMETVNPMKLPSGQKELGVLRLEWNSTAHVPSTRSKDTGTFILGLYKTEVKVTLGDEFLQQFEMITLGTQRSSGDPNEEDTETKQPPKNQPGVTKGFME